MFSKDSKRLLPFMSNPQNHLVAKMQALVIKFPQNVLVLSENEDAYSIRYLADPKYKPSLTRFDSDCDFEVDYSKTAELGAFRSNFVKNDADTAQVIWFLLTRHLNIHALKL